MALANEDISFIKQHLSEWIAEETFGKPTLVLEIEQRERIIRVEEELKHQRTLIQQILHQMDKRFEQVEKRFEQVDKRFEQVDKRFEQIDKRFDELVRRLDRFMFWSLGLTVTSAIFVVKYLS